MTRSVMPKVVQVAPFNVWTPEEFESWIGSMATEENAARRDSGMGEISETEMGAFIAMTVRSINFNVVPAGNA